MTDKRDRDRERKRYADDPEYRLRRLASINAYRKARRAQINAQRRLRWATDPEYRERQLAPRRGDYWRERDLMRHYGITLRTYNALLAKQKRRCAICKKKSSRTLHVDHCHQTRAVRRLLCGKCNRGLGHFGDDLQIVRNAAAYLAEALKLRRKNVAMRAPKASPRTVRKGWPRSPRHQPGQRHGRQSSM